MHRLTATDTPMVRYTRTIFPSYAAQCHPHRPIKNTEAAKFANPLIIWKCHGGLPFERTATL